MMPTVLLSVTMYLSGKTSPEICNIVLVMQFYEHKINGVSSYALHKLFHP